MVLFSTESGKWAVGNPSQLDDNSHYLVTDTKHFCFWPHQMKLWGRRSNGVFEPLNQVRVLQDYAVRKARVVPNGADNEDPRMQHLQWAPRVIVRRHRPEKDEERDRAAMPPPAALPARLQQNQGEPAAQANRPAAVKSAPAPKRTGETGTGSAAKKPRNEARREFFLPKQLNGVVVLVKAPNGAWHATNEHLKSDTLGISYRATKDLESRMPGAHLAWNSCCFGVDEGDWVRSHTEADREVWCIKDQMAMLQRQLDRTTDQQEQGKMTAELASLKQQLEVFTGPLKQADGNNSERGKSSNQPMP